MPGEDWDLTKTEYSFVIKLSLMSFLLRFYFLYNTQIFFTLKILMYHYLFFHPISIIKKLFSLIKKMYFIHYIFRAYFSHLSVLKNSLPLYNFSKPYLRLNLKRKTKHLSSILNTIFSLWNKSKLKILLYSKNKSLTLIFIYFRSKF